MEQIASNSSGAVTISGHTHLNTSGQLLERILLVVAPIFSWVTLFVGAVGIIGNILTILVFGILGFAETINISYVALAVSDLCCILSSMWIGFCYSTAMQTLLDRLGVQVEIAKFSVFTGIWPQFAFSRVTGFVTGWISLERCLCVLFPTRVRLMITKKVTKRVITAIFVIGCSPIMFAYVGIKTVWSLDPATNTTTLYMSYSFEEDRNIFFSIMIFLYAVVYPMLSWTLVTTCTTLLIIKLRQSGRWRRANVTIVPVTNRDFPNVPNNWRENRTTKTVLMIASVFIACSLPKSVQSLVSLMLREKYSLYGSLRSLFMFNAASALLLTQINSSTNIIFYTITGAKFRSTLKKMLAHKSKRN